MSPTPKTDKMLVKMRNGKPATFFRRTIVYADDYKRLELELAQTRALKEANAALGDLVREIADETQCYREGPRPYSGDSYLPEPIKEKILAILAQAQAKPPGDTGGMEGEK